MQPSLKLKVSVEQQDLLKGHTADINSLLDTVITENTEPIGYFLQAYYPKEKVRGAKVVPGSIAWKDDTALLKLIYTLEEFNACSAVNTEDRKQMPVTLVIDRLEGGLNLVGEYWPQA